MATESTLKKADAYKASLGDPTSSRFDAWEDIGITPEGFELQQIPDGQVITAFGATTVIDGVYRGGNCFLNFTATQWKRPAIQNLIYQYQQVPDWGTGFIQPTNHVGHEGYVGCGYVEFSLPVRLERLRDTPCSSSPKFYTFYAAVLAEQRAISWAFSNALYAVPISLRCLGWWVGDGYAWYWTADAVGG